MKDRFWLTFLILLSTAGLGSQAESNDCQARYIATGIGQPRLATIDFPDGRQLSIIGQVHGSRDLQDFIVSGKDVDEFVTRAEIVLAAPSVQKALRYLREDVALLRTALQGDVEFVGLEIDHQFLPDYKTASGMLYEAFQRNQLAKVSQTQALTPLTLLFIGGPANYLSVLEPQLLDKIEMIGIEDAVLGDKDSEALKEMSDAFGVLLEAAGTDQAFLDFLDKKDHHLSFEVYPEFDPKDPADENAVLGQVLEFPEKHRAIAKTYLESNVKYFRTLSDRDDFSAQKILKLRKSGITLTGLMHQKPIMNRLQKACRLLL